VSTPARPADRPSDRALWNAVVVTLRERVVPALDGGSTEDVALLVDRLAVLAEYARDRGPGRAAELDTELRRLVGDDDVVAVLCDPGDDRRTAVRELLRADLDRSIATEAGLLGSLGFV
jgi:hypothetical protein